MELTDEALILSIGTGYANQEHWVYEVDPVGPLEADPEVRGHYLSPSVRGLG